MCSPLRLALMVPGLWLGIRLWGLPAPAFSAGCTWYQLDRSLEYRAHCNRGPMNDPLIQLKPGDLRRPTGVTGWLGGTACILSKIVTMHSTRTHIDRHTHAHNLHTYTHAQPSHVYVRTTFTPNLCVHTFSLCTHTSRPGSKKLSGRAQKYSKPHLCTIPKPRTPIM